MLDADARYVEAGHVLLQKQPKPTKRPIDYWSRSLINAELDYDTLQKECLAIVSLALLLRLYLEGAQITHHTDG